MHRRTAVALLFSLLALPGLAACSAAVPAAGPGGAATAGSTKLADRPDVVVYRGIHTVYHSKSPLPSPSAPRADGRLTVVWFSGTW